MTVSQLIQALSQKAPNARVVIHDGESDNDLEVVDALTQEDGNGLFVELVSE